MIIYKIINRVNGMIYIGQTKFSLSHRIKEHIKKETYIGNSLRKYKLDSFEFIIVESIDSILEANERECYWIKELNCKWPNGYNLTDGGGGVIDFSGEIGKRISKTKQGHKVSQETRDKLSIANKGKVLSEETKQKISDNSARHNLGKVLSEEIKQKIREKRALQIITEETKRKIGEAGRGRKLSEETKRKMAKSQKGKGLGRIPWNKGKTGIYSEETKKKIGEASRGRITSEETKRKISEKLLMFWSKQ